MQQSEVSEARLQAASTDDGRVLDRAKEAGIGDEGGGRLVAAAICESAMASESPIPDGIIVSGSNDNDHDVAVRELTHHRTSITAKRHASTRIRREPDQIKPNIFQSWWSKLTGSSKPRCDNDHELRLTTLKQSRPTIGTEALTEETNGKTSKHVADAVKNAAVAQDSSSESPLRNGKLSSFEGVIENDDESNADVKTVVKSESTPSRPSLLASPFKDAPCFGDSAASPSTLHCTVTLVDAKDKSTASTSGEVAMPDRSTEETDSLMQCQDAPPIIESSSTAPPSISTTNVLVKKMRSNGTSPAVTTNTKDEKTYQPSSDDALDATTASTCGEHATPDRATDKTNSLMPCQDRPSSLSTTNEQDEKTPSRRSSPAVTTDAKDDEIDQPSSDAAMPVCRTTEMAKTDSFISKAVDSHSLAAPMDLMSSNAQVATAASLSCDDATSNLDSLLGRLVEEKVKAALELERESTSSGATAVLGPARGASLPSGHPPEMIDCGVQTDDILTAREMFQVSDRMSRIEGFIQTIQGEVRAVKGELSNLTRKFLATQSDISDVKDSITTVMQQQDGKLLRIIALLERNEKQGQVGVVDTCTAGNVDVTEDRRQSKESTHRATGPAAVTELESMKKETAKGTAMSESREDGSWRHEIQCPRSMPTTTVETTSPTLLPGKGSSKGRLAKSSNVGDITTTIADAPSKWPSLDPAPCRHDSSEGPAAMKVSDRGEGTSLTKSRTRPSGSYNFGMPVGVPVLDPMYSHSSYKESAARGSGCTTNAHAWDKGEDINSTNLMTKLGTGRDPVISRGGSVNDSPRPQKLPRGTIGTKKNKPLVARTMAPPGMESHAMNAVVSPKERAADSMGCMSPAVESVHGDGGKAARPSAGNQEQDNGKVQSTSEPTSATTPDRSSRSLVRSAPENCPAPRQRLPNTVDAGQPNEESASIPQARTGKADLGTIPQKKTHEVAPQREISRTPTKSSCNSSSTALRQRRSTLTLNDGSTVSHSPFVPSPPKRGIVKPERPSSSQNETPLPDQANGNLDGQASSDQRNATSVSRKTQSGDPKTRESSPNRGSMRRDCSALTNRAPSKSGLHYTQQQMREGGGSKSKKPSAATESQSSTGLDSSKQTRVSRLGRKVPAHPLCQGPPKGSPPPNMQGTRVGPSVAARQFSSETQIAPSRPKRAHEQDLGDAAAEASLLCSPPPSKKKRKETVARRSAAIALRPHRLPEYETSAAQGALLVVLNNKASPVVP